MRLRRVVGSAAAVVSLVAGVSLAAAPAASAVSLTINGCLQFNYIAPAGSTFIVTFDGCEYRDLFQTGGTTVDATDPAAVIVHVGAGASSWGSVINTGPNFNNNFGPCESDQPGWTHPLLDYCQEDSPTDSITAAADDAPPIPAWVQAHGRSSKDATCEDGWGQSWHEWAQNITDGWVCTRSIPSLG